MPLPINRVPPGLLSLLDTKSGGVNPLVLSDELSGSLELLPFYAAATGQQYNGDSVAAAAVGQLAPLGAGDNMRVPASQLWVVPFFNVRSGAVLAGGNCNVCLCVYNTSLGSLIWSSPNQAFVAGERVCIGTDRTLVLGPGYGLGIHISGMTAAAQVFQFNAYMSRLSL